MLGKIEPPVLEFQHVSKAFSHYNILSNVSFHINMGEKIGLVGPVGSGKTTLLYTALGLITPDSGSVSIFSLPLTTERQKILQRVNLASSTLKLNGYASIDENLLTFARLYQIPNPKQKIDELLALFNIAHLRHRKVYNLSAGENSKVNLCKALINDPELLLLDEITAYLDQRSKNALYKRLLNNKRCAVLFASHNPRDLAVICSRTISLKKGGI